MWFWVVFLQLELEIKNNLKMTDKRNNNANYLTIVLLHLFIGVLVFYVKPLAIVYSGLIFFGGLFFIIKNRDNNNEAIFWASYMVGAEVFFRMSKFVISHEFAKYTVLVFMFLAIYFKGVSRKGVPYAIFLLLLVPGFVIGVLSLSFEADVRKAIVFNMVGPVCLAVSSVYMAGKEFSFNDFEKLTRWMMYPMIAMLVYLFLHNPSIKEVITGTDSNSATSGGFGPNQVSTVLGLGMFLAFVRLLFFSKTPLLVLFNLALLSVFSYRGIITFSRGGVYTGLAMIIVLMVSVYPFISLKNRIKINLMAIFLGLFGAGVFAYSISQTGGMILNRYKGEDALGREKASKFSGREELASSELQMFIDNPVLGIGVGKNKEYREENFNINAVSHNELTRMLAEHGAFGIVNLLILFITPLVFYRNNNQHLFLLSFLVFWFLTINHAAMRIAAPAFLYALTLLKVTVIEKPAVHRE